MCWLSAAHRIYSTLKKAISIQTEHRNHGDWIKIFIPWHSDEMMQATLQNDAGDTIKTVQIFEGNNAIDISNIKTSCINIKIETAFETVLKKLQLDIL